MKVRAFSVLSVSDLKSVYWAARRRPATLAAFVRMIGKVLISYASFRRATSEEHSGRPSVVVAMVECMGDIVAAEPIARLVRQLHPHHRVVWVTKRGFTSIPAAFQAVDSVFEVSCLSEWLLLWRLNPGCLVYDLHPVGHHCGECGLPVKKPKTLVTVTDLLVGRNLLSAMCLSGSLPEVEDSPSLTPPSAARRAVDLLNLPDRFIVIHCESTDVRKEWPAEKWRMFCSEISRKSGLDCYEVGLHPIVATDGDSFAISLCGELSIMETAEVIRRAAVFVGIDSGPAHLANAVGARAVLLLGSYRNFARYMPFSGGYCDGTRAKVVRTDGPAVEIDVSEVVRACIEMI